MKRAVFVSVLLALALAGTGASGQDSGNAGPHITEARLFLRDGLLMGDVTSSGLFSERVTGTIQSGLPAVVELLYRLVARERDKGNLGLRVYELSYDVWNDRYAVRDDDSTRHYVSFETMTRAVEHLQTVALIPIAAIDHDKEYAVEFSIAVHPLRSRDKRQIAGWVSEQVRGDGDASWHESVLNLNDLISHFFSRTRDGENRSQWFRTGFFNPRGLTRNSREDD